MTQADNTTTQAPAVTPIPTEQQAVKPGEALERARANDNRPPVELGVDNLYSEFEQFGDAPRTYREGGAVSGEYWMYRFRGAIVNMSPKFKAEFDKGTIQKIIATPTVGERTVPDPNNSGMTMQQIVYGYSVTFSGAEALEKALIAKKAAAKVKMETMIQEKTQDAKIAATLEMITPEMIKGTVRTADIDELLKAI